jgi:hypothetical protein
MRTGSHQVGPRHMSLPDPCLSRASVFSAPESRDPDVGSSDPTQRGLGPVLEVRVAPAGALDLPPEARSSSTGVRCFPHSGSEPTVCILEYVSFPSHVATLEPSTWRGRESFATQLGIVARA